MDIRWGCNNIQIKEGDEWKAAFKTNRGLFEPTIMFFGLCNSPATFQNMMNDIFREEITKGEMEIYMDDILVFTETMEAHIAKNKQILNKLKLHGLSLKLEKCYFDQTTIGFLGLVIEPGVVKMEEEKVKAINNWPTPKNKKNVQQFLGFLNFYQQFI